MVKARTRTQTSKLGERISDSCTEIKFLSLLTRGWMQLFTPELIQASSKNPWGPEIRVQPRACTGREVAGESGGVS